MMELPEIDFLKITASIIALAVAIIGHEIMHGFVAHLYGDHTAKQMGRLSINPIVHVDILGTVILPLMLFITGAPFLFGWAKPVPVNAHTVLRNRGSMGMVHVSLAGVAFNFAVALIAGMMISESFPYMVNLILFYLVMYNVILGMFNLLPIPPLDGSQTLSYLGRYFGIYKIGEWFDRIGNYGMIILVLFLISPLSQLFFFYVQNVIKWMLG